MAKKVKQLIFTTPNKVGVLSQVTDTLKASGVNILHAIACGEGRRGYFEIVTSDDTRALLALKKLGIRPQKKDALLLTLSNKPGALAAKARLLARNRINVKGVAATSAGNRVSVILKTSNDAKAAGII